MPWRSGRLDGRFVLARRMSGGVVRPSRDGLISRAGPPSREIVSTCISFVTVEALAGADMAAIADAGSWLWSALPACGRHARVQLLL